jgi:sulfate permease, SulP family
VLIVNLTEVSILVVTSSLALENTIKEDIDNEHDVIVIGATGKVKNRLEKLGIAGLIPEYHRMDDRLLALQKGLNIVGEKQSRNYEDIDSYVSPLT